ncbi:MAG: hypothetical protein J7J30_05375 [Candidatus Odinarchaeota archaeon]|nr:hypothetical protein [Candidatus Odinarchaeota archaeon]
MQIEVAAFMLFILGVVFMLLEAKVGHGGLGALGAALMIITSFIILLFPPTFPGEIHQILILLTFGLDVILIPLIAFIIYKATKVRELKKIHDLQALIGKTGITKTRLSPRGIVYAEGEDWTATTRNGIEIPPETKVKIVGLEKLTLIVEKEE